jgi:hypothetical protein
MTFAAVPALRQQSDLATSWLPKISARVYDPRNVPVAAIIARATPVLRPIPSA